MNQHLTERYYGGKMTKEQFDSIENEVGGVVKVANSKGKKISEKTAYKIGGLDHECSEFDTNENMTSGLIRVEIVK